MEEIIDNNDDKYVGELKDGKYNGMGTLTNFFGEIYVGEFKDNKKSGTGTLTSHNGQIYAGEFKDNEYNGTGTLTYPDGMLQLQSTTWLHLLQNPNLISFSVI